jgi:peptidoglycan/LPS O-acetylase OafA/YrhL
MPERAALAVTPASETASSPAERLHLEYIDSIRALAALFVVLCHAFYQPANGYYAERFMNKLGLSYGSLAVDVFIVVSGFCLMLPVTRRGALGSLKTFFYRRARRILPPYLVTVLLSSAFTLTLTNFPTGTVWDNCVPFHIVSFWRHLFLVQTIPWPQVYPGINYPLWSIAVEAHIYLCMPLLVQALRRFGMIATATGTLALTLALEIGLKGQLRETRHWYLMLFLMGMIAAQESYHQRVRRGWGTLAIALAVLIVGFILAAGRSRAGTLAPYLDMTVGLMTALTLGVLLRDSGAKRLWLSRALSWRPLVAIGLFSYSLYLVHAPLLHALWMIYHSRLHPAPVPMFLMLVASIPLLVALAYLFYIMFERPFLNSRPEVKKASR